MRRSDASQKPLAQEWHGSRLVKQWGSRPTADDSHADQPAWPTSLGTQLLDVLSKTFMPEGFPGSVSSDYLAFQAWDTVQAVSSYVRGMLSSQAIMHGIGVGREAATAYGAVYLFAVRDLTGMLGGLVFAHLEGSGFDSCAKQWRLFADVMNDLAMAVDLATPLFPSAFLPMACVASLARAVTGVAGGATRAALTQHFAQCGNAADIAAKEQSQETAVTAIGMVLGMLLTRHCANSHAWAWVWFLVLTAVHIWANVRAMRCLVLTSINQPRLDTLLQAYLAKGSVATPDQMSTQEDLMPPPFRRLLSWVSGPGSETTTTMPHLSRVRLGVSLSTAAAGIVSGAGRKAGGSGRGGPSPAQEYHQQLESAVSQLIKEQGHRRYMLVASSSGAVQAVLHKEADAHDVMRAYVHAWTVARFIKADGVKTSAKQADAWMQAHYKGLQSQLEACGWQLGNVRLPKGGVTAEWDAARSLQE